MRNGTAEGLNANGGVSDRCVTVELLTGEHFLVSIEGKTTCSTIWSRVEEELVARGAVYPQIFGLAIKTAGLDWVFVDPDAKVSKYFPKEWKQAYPNNAGFIPDGKTLTLYCRVHFYLEDLPHNLDVVSLHHYYLQLRQNLISTPRAPSKNLTQTVAFAYQAELGDWRPGQELPKWAKDLTGGGSAVGQAHQALAGMGQDAARLAFVRAAMPKSNMHLYAMTLRTKEGKEDLVWIGVTPKGIEVYQNTSGSFEVPEQPKITFLWANITKLYFERKKFEICGRASPWVGSTQKLSFTSAWESVPRHLLILCRSTHQFHLSNQKMMVTSGSESAGVSRGPPPTSSSSNTVENSSAPQTLAPTSSSNAQQKSEENMLDLSLWADGLLFSSNSQSSKHQRVSVISNASSNTTSGIVSDRVYSLDGSEEELDLREMPYSCAETEAIENPRECFPQAPPPPARNPTVPTPTAKSRGSGAGSACCAESEAAKDPNKAPAMVDEGKFWYCDSDCEDCEDAAAPCRSSLVRTIGEKRACTGQCDCNSCATGDELDDLDGSIPFAITHQNSPSMVSDGTLKAVEIPEGAGEDTTDHNSTPHNRTPVPEHRSCKFGVNTGDIINNSSGWPKGKDSVAKKLEKLSVKDIAEDKNKCKKRLGNPELRIELKDDLDDPAEHVYGEISEERTTNDGDGRLYCTIDNNAKKCLNNKCEVSGSRSTCASCVKLTSCKERSSCSSCNSNSVHRTKPLDATTKQNGNSNNSCCSSCKCVNRVSSHGSSTTSTSNPPILGTKVNVLTPKIASLKCLKPKNSLSTVTSSSCSWLPSKKLVRKKNAVKGKKTATIQSSSSQSLELSYPFHSSCIDFGEKIQQGRYPSTKTVSDNFDTDSDYVQLPPLSVQQKNQSIWKFVRNGRKNAECSKHCKQCGPYPPSINTPTASSCFPGSLHSLPRRHKFEHSLSVSKNEPPKLPFMKAASKSTMALNTISDEEPRKPEPPPKPAKRNNTTAENKNRAVDARFIATKPQILVQTAYATAAPVAIPSKAQILCRRSKVPSSTSVVCASNFKPRSILKRPPNTNLFHSQSVDNIYDVVASEEIPEPRPLTPSPPPFKHSSDYMKGSVVVKPNNYIDVHASANQNRKSCLNINDKVIYAPPSEGSSAAGKGIFNRCGSVPNNLNNFFIGLQNLKPLSRSPIVHPGATSTASLVNNSCNNLFPGERNDAAHPRLRSQCKPEAGKPEDDNINARCATVYTSQLTQSQIQQFKAQLYSDMDYVIFPPKDPRLSQQEYYDSKSLSYSALTNANSAVPYGISGIPPPYLPPPPPYAATTGAVPPPRRPPAEPPVPPRPTVGPLSKQVTNGSCSATSLSSCHKSYGSIYKPGSTTSCSSSQYARGYYGAVGSLNLNEENIHRFLSTQSLTSSNVSSAPVYYPCSTQSAPPLPPYNRAHGNNPEYSIIIENEMRKAVQNHLINHPDPTIKLGSNGNFKDEKLRLKLCRSEESLYVQPPKTVEEQLLAMHNLPPPPPYSRTKMSQNDLDLASLRAKCQAMELPLLRALCSDGALLTQTKPRPKVRPTAHAHPKAPAKKPLPPTPQPDCDKPPPLPQKPKIS